MSFMNTRHVPSLELCQEFDRLCKENGIVMPETDFGAAGGNGADHSREALELQRDLIQRLKTEQGIQTK